MNGSQRRNATVSSIYPTRLSSRASKVSTKRKILAIIEGPIGAGKTHAIAQTFLSKKSDADVIIAAGNPFESGFQSAGFSVWCTIINRLVERIPGSLEDLILEALELASKVYEESTLPRGRKLQEKVKRRPDTSQLHLLNPILGTDFKIDPLCSKPLQCDLRNLDDKLVTIINIYKRVPNSAEKMSTKQMQNELAVQKIISLISGIVAGLCVKVEESVITIIDDTNSMNVLSWLVTLELTQWWNATKILMVLSLRTLYKQSFNDVKQYGGKLNLQKSQKDEQLEQLIYLRKRLITFSNAEYLQLTPKLEYTHDIICHARGVKNVNGALVTFLNRKTNGNPLFIVDALSQFEAEGLISVKGAELVLTGLEFHNRSQTNDLAVPISVESVCGMLLDSLSTTQQVALKVAAMIGKEFSCSDVRKRFPIQELKDELTGQWYLLVDTGIIEEVRDGEATTPRQKKGRMRKGDDADKRLYRFKSEWMKESLMHRMLYKQKKALASLL